MYEQHVDVAVLAVGEGFAVPTEIHFRSMPVSFLKMGWRYSRRPVSCVLVVVAIIKVSALAIWGSSRREKDEESSEQTH